MTERGGEIRQIKRGQLLRATYATVPLSESERKSSTLDIAVNPADGKIFVSHVLYVSGQATLAVSKGTDTGTGITGWSRVLTLPARAFEDHLGGRMIFKNDGSFLLTTGERRETELAQDDTSPWGKILRVNATSGTYFNFTKGHRNALGLAYEGNGRLWSSENGPSGFDAPGGGDEVNLIDQGANYGWPTIHHDQTAPGMRAPGWQSGDGDAVAPGGAVIPTAGRWAGKLVVPCLKGRRLLVFSLTTGKPVLVETALVALGSRLRTAIALSDGSLLVTTSDSESGSKVDRLVRVMP